jgi:serine/threonine protein kinase
MEPYLAPGVRFGKYEIVALLGEGGMGLVYEALHVDLKKRVAIKTLNAALAAVPEATVRFRREGEAAARIRHPNVVDVTDVGVEAGIPYLVMEYLEGRTLGQYLNRKEPLSITETADLALPIIAALAAGHDAGVIHRDLKPSNIFLVADRVRRENVPKVLDFGVSKLADAQGAEQQALTRTGAHLGTICYMSPEQALGAKQADARSDQYALGLILYECVTGRRAYRDDDDNTFALLRRIGDNRFEPPLAIRPDLQPAFADLVLRTLAHQMADRFESMSALGAAMLQFGSARAVMSWERVFKRDTLPSLDVVPFEGAGSGDLNRGIAATMLLGQGTAEASVGNEAGPAPVVEKPEIGHTQLLPQNPRGAAPESRSASGLAFEALPAATRSSAISTRRFAVLASALLLGAAVVILRGIGSSSSHAPPSRVADVPAAGELTPATGASQPPGPSPTTAAASSPAPSAAPLPVPIAPLPTIAPSSSSRDVSPASAHGLVPRPPAHAHHTHKGATAADKPGAPVAPRVGANNAKIME